MPLVKQSVQSRRDIDGIVDWIAADNLAAADRWFEAMDRVFQMLATHPESGEQIETRRFGVVRRHCHGNYVVYYRPRSYGAFIVRVLHGARDSTQQL